MTDDETPDPLDELASAHLDGLTSPDEAARIEGDPALTARVAAFREVREGLRAPVAIDPGRRDAAIAAALAAAVAGPTTDELAAARVHRSARRGWVPAIGIAAAVAAAALLLPRLGGDDGGDAVAARDRAAVTTTAGPLIASAPAGGAGPAESGAGLGDAEAPVSTFPGAGDTGSSTQMAVLPAVDLGPANDLDALVDAARAELSHPAAPVVPTPPEEGLDPCFATVAATAGPDGRVVLRFRATVRDESALGVVVEHPDGRRTLAAASVGGCRLLGSVEL